jgi:hypothetical protein
LNSSINDLSLLLRRLDEIERKLDCILEELRPTAIGYSARRGIVQGRTKATVWWVVKMTAFISVAIAGLLYFTTYVSAQPSKELYELQERCDKTGGGSL